MAPQQFLVDSPRDRRQQVLPVHRLSPQALPSLLTLSMQETEAADKPKGGQWERRNLLWKGQFEYFDHSRSARSAGLGRPRALAPPAACAPTPASDVGGGHTPHPRWTGSAPSTPAPAAAVRAAGPTLTRCLSGRHSHPACAANTAANTRGGVAPECPGQPALRPHTAAEPPLATRQGPYRDLAPLAGRASSP